MNVSFIAKILTPDGERGWRISTGYPVKKGLVLTACHVINSVQEEKIIVEWPGLSEKLDTIKTKIVYKNKDCDIALIACTTPDMTEMSPFMISDHPPVAHQNWESWGFARMGKPDEESEPHRTSAIGICHPMNENGYSFSLDVRNDGETKDEWKGMSGAPVFSGVHLYGVITRTPIKQKNLLTATALSYLLKPENDSINPSFITLVGCTSIEQNFMSSIRYVDEYKSLRSILFQHFSKTDTSLKDSSFHLVQYLVKLPLSTLLVSLRDLTRKSSASHKKSLMQLLKLILPKYFASGARIKSNPTNHAINIIKIPYATELSAEILMASADQRSMAFELYGDSSSAHLKATKFCMALPPESGNDAKQPVKDVIDDLSNALALSVQSSDLRVRTIDYLFEDKLPPQRRKADSERKIQKIQAWLRIRKKESDPSLYWVLPSVESELEKGTLKDLVDGLKSHFPELVFMSLMEDNDQEDYEEKLYSTLVTIEKELGRD